LSEPRFERERIEYMELGALRRFPKNPKDHDLAELGEAFERRGYVTPMLIDETSGCLVEGHGRLEKLEMMRQNGEAAPRRIEVKGQRWFVPVVRGVAFDSLEQAREHVVAANRIGEGLWNSKLLAAALTKLGADRLIGTGFKESDIVHFAALAKGPMPPSEFPAVGSDLSTDYCCPKCGHAWSGNPKAGARPAEPDGEAKKA
jgi:hypothetical protein